MYEFSPRPDAVAADRSPPVRIVPAVTAVQPSGGTAGSAGDAGVGGDGGGEARREHMASAADYARVQARIAEILSQMNESAGPVFAKVMANAEIEAMLPRSTVIIPIPPASTEAIERALKLARDMANQAELTRAAQANVDSGTVAQILAPAA